MNRLHASQEDLLAFALDQRPLSPAVRQHLDQCDFCQEQVICYQNTVTYLLPRLYRNQCPSGSDLSYYCLPGALSETEQSQISKHLACCPLCASELAETYQFLER
jgi:anti-sigma factor ChrR (cupin superfamily)